MAWFYRQSWSSSLYTYMFITVAVKFCRAELWGENSDNTKIRTTAKCALNSQQSELNSFLWTLERDPPSYFFGTIHVPYTRVWDYIPQSTKDAFRYSDSVYFELDLTDGATAVALASCQLLPEGKTIAEFLSKKLYRRLTRHMEYIRKKIPDWMGGDNQNSAYSDYQYSAMVGSWKRMKPVWLMLLLNSLTESDVRLFGVPVLDLYLSRQGVLWEKKIGAIEEVEEQCGPLNNLNHTQVIFALDQTLRQHEQYRRKSQSMPENDDLIAHYNCGDLKSVLLKKDTLKVDLTALQQQESGKATMAKEMDDYFQNELLFKRNKIMSERIIKLLEENPKESFFFAFGAGHYLGNNSVIDKLIASGLPITHTEPDSFIQSHAKRASYNREPFSHMDSSSLLDSPQYMDTMKKLNQAGMSGDRAIRHRKHKGRRRSRDPKERHFGDDNKLEESSFTKLWIRVEEISQVTEDTKSIEYIGAEATPITSTTSSILFQQKFATICLLPLLVLIIHYFLYNTIL